MRSCQAMFRSRRLRNGGFILSFLVQSLVALLLLSPLNPLLAQRPSKKYPRATPPNLEEQDFSGIYFDDAIKQLRGERPSASSAGMAKGNSKAPVPNLSSSESEGEAGSSDWKSLISDITIEDLIKESKARLDQTITTPAKFAAGGFKDARQEFTLLATLMAIIDEYPEQIRWKNSANYARRIFAKMANNSAVGTPPVYNEAKLRQQDLQELLKGSNLSGAADEVDWEQTADRGPLMQLLEWSLRKNLSPKTSSDDEFSSSQEELLKYAELIAAYGRVLQQSGMTDADDESYAQMAGEMTSAATDLVKAVQLNNPDAARTSVGRIDQSCSKCHESYR